MGASTERIAIDIQTSANVQPVKDLNTAIQGTIDESKELGRLMKEQGLSMDQAAKKIVELRNATQSLGSAATAAAGGASGGAGGGSSSGGGLAAIPDLLNRTNEKVDAMSPRLRTAATAFSRLAFEAGGFGGTAQGAVRSVGMLTYSLASLSSSAAVAAGASGIGALAIVVSAGIGLWEDYETKVKRVSDRTQELNDAHVKLVAEFRGNKLGALEVDLNQQYLKQVQAIQKDQPGMLARAWAEILAGAGVLQNSSSLLRASFDAYGGRQVTLGGQTNQAAANRAQAEAIAKAALGRQDATAFAVASLEMADTPIAKYRAQLRVIEVERDNAIKGGELSAAAANARAVAQTSQALREYSKAVFDNAAKFASEDLSKNDVFAKSLAPAWNAMWQRFSLDAEVRKGATDIIKKMVREPFETAAHEVQSEAQSGLAGALQGFQNLKEAGPLLGRGFGGTQGEFRKQFDEVTKGAKSMGAALGSLTANEIPALATGFTKAFAGIASGKNVFKSLEDVALQSIEHVAAGMAASEFAQGIAMVARSIWDFLGPNPAAGLSATQHFAAAGLFATLAGGAGVAASGGGSGGGGGGAAANGNTFAPNAQQAGGNQTIVIHIGDVSNAALVQSVAYELNRAEILNKPIVVPYGRPS